MEVSLIFKIAAVGILVSVLCQILKHSGRDEQAFLVSLAKYTLVVVAPNIGETHPDGRELGGGNTGAPIFRDIINSLIK